MIYVDIPVESERRLSFYLAAEEFAARRLNTDDDLFFMWQVAPTVIFGRNQVIENEVNLQYCREHGIAFFRRRSGGGCVYADHSNVMMSYITRSDEVVTTFSRYLRMVTALLCDLGLAAASTANNDVLVDGRKISGNAFYHIPGHSIVHGTMLFDTDMEHMLNAITPPQTKLAAHGVESVRQRITLMKEHNDLTIPEFMAFARQRLCERTYTLTPADLQAVEAIEREYLKPGFIYGAQAPATDMKA
ncbi:MAG: lipoate--protein ligase family protein [Bacteroidales bacterium]|nr:lipoate--protein ligase family protein [Bacteroidales bacterium]